MAATLLDLHVTASAGYTMVEVAGEIDVKSAPELRDCLHQTIDTGSRQLVVDLRQVDFIDSMGLGCWWAPSGACAASTVPSTLSVPRV